MHILQNTHKWKIFTPSFNLVDHTFNAWPNILCELPIYSLKLLLILLIIKKSKLFEILTLKKHNYYYYEGKYIVLSSKTNL